MPSDDDRIAYLGGEHAGPLDPGDEANLDRLRGLLDEPAMWSDPDSSLEDRIVAAIAAEASAAAEASPTRSAPTTEPEGARGHAPTTRTTHGNRLARGPGRWVLAGVAAAAALVVGIVVSQQNSSQGQRSSVALAATGAVPTASGSATLTRTTAGWRITLHATGLPRLDNGRFYEAWLRNSSNVGAPIGTFNDGPVVTLWSGVSPRQFMTLTVTEQAVGSSSPGPVVLSGNVAPGG
jgi:hypothetical protein